MVRVEVRKEEPIDKALRKFKSKIKREVIIEEIKRRESDEKPSQRKRRQLAQAVKREKRRLREQEWQ